jgi:hypothetical protein
MKQITAMLFMLLFLCATGNIFAENTNNTGNIEQNTLTAAELEQSDVLELNNEIMFSFSIPKGEYVRLSIFNNKGVEIKVLVDEDKTQGEFNVDLSQAKLTNGTYYYKLVVGKYKELKKMNYTTL